VSLVPLLVVAALVSIVAIALTLLGLPVWLAALLGVAAMPGVLRLLDVVTSAPVRARNRRVHATPCPSCGLPLGPSAHWRISHPDYHVECPSCHAVPSTRSVSFSGGSRRAFGRPNKPLQPTSGGHATGEGGSMGSAARG